MEPKVSIIVPVYNAEKSLARCVDSILNQEFRDFELILMDDGSKDRSGEICDGYARADARVVVVHKENTGVSDTRNQAIARARGTFLQFVDSDDWLTADATKLMVRAAEETGCDMVIADFYRVVGEMVSQKGDIDADQVIGREAFVGFMMENPADYYYGVLWNKLYRRSLVEAHGIGWMRSSAGARIFCLISVCALCDDVLCAADAGLLLCEDEGFAGESEDQLRADGGDETRDVRVLQRLLQACAG